MATTDKKNSSGDEVVLGHRRTTSQSKANSVGEPVPTIRRISNSNGNGHIDMTTRRQRWLYWIGGIVVVLIIFRLCLPFLVKDYVNRKLNQGKDFGGRISHVDIQLWRGQYRIHAVEIFKKSGEHKTPLFSAARIDLAVEWSELFHGAVVGEVTMRKPQVNFLSGPPTDETISSSKNESWDKMLESLFPFKLNRVEIDDGQVHFQNPYSKPPVDVYLQGLSATATNLTNARDLHQQLPAGIKAKGTTIGGGGLDLDLQLNPVAKAPTYQLACQLTNVDLTALNSFLEAYGKFDVGHGKFALFTSVASKDGTYDGYAKVFFQDMKVFAWPQDEKKNPLELAWKVIVGTLSTAFKNHNTDNLATRVPLSGTYDKSSVGIWSAIATLLRNAFVHALTPKLDEPVTVQQVEKKTQQKQELQQEPAATDKKGAQGLSSP